MLGKKWWEKEPLRIIELEEGYDFSKHNEEVKKIWDSFHKEKPSRVPVQFSMNPRMVILNPELNKWRYSFKDYFENSDVRWKIELEFQKIEYPSQRWGFADDSISLISLDMYKEFVLPYHKKLLENFSQGGPNSIHLCGKVQHHLKFLKEELNIKTFDLGFPTDMGKAREDLGEDVTLIGNIAPHLLKDGPKDKIREEVKKLCRSEVMKSRKFILHDGNNCAPLTPVEHFKTMYEAGKEYGRYEKL